VEEQWVSSVAQESKKNGRMVIALSLRSPDVVAR
jgi:hypothetical protein